MTQQVEGRSHLKGIIPVLQVPFTQDGEIDEDDLRLEVEYCIESGVDGVVVPIMGSEFWVLTDLERRRIIDLVVQSACHRVAVIAGVAAPSARWAANLSREAACAGVDALIALPPYVRKPRSLDVVADYYRAIAEASELSLVLQNAPPPEGLGLAAEQIRDLLDAVPHIRYVKEEQVPSIQAIARLNRICGKRLSGIFSGTCGAYLLSELDRGATGCMPSAAFVKPLVQVYRLYVADQRDAAHTAFRELLPLLHLECVLGVAASKEALRLQGIVKHTCVRDPQSVPLEQQDRAELATEYRRVYANLPGMRSPGTTSNVATRDRTWP